MRQTDASTVIGAGLKMYLGHARTLRWVQEVAEQAGGHPAVVSGYTRLFVLPAFPALVPTLHALAGTRIEVGAQDLFWEDRGAFTGEVSGADLAEIGCTLVEVGHVERRRLGAETDEIVADKTLAAFRNGLTPVLCIGEPEQVASEVAVQECRRQLGAALAAARAAGGIGRLVVAYEPQWAIGVARPAAPEHVRVVTAELRRMLLEEPGCVGSRVIYGGSAGVGLLAELGTAVDGLFLGRSAHDPATLVSVLDEVWALRPTDP